MNTMKNENNWCCINIRRGAIIVAFFSLLCAVSSLGHNLTEQDRPPNSGDGVFKSFYVFKYSSIPSMIHDDIVTKAHTILYFVFSVLLLQGALLSKPNLMFPWLCIEISETVLSLTAIILSVVCDTSLYSNFTNDEIFYGASFWIVGYGLEIFCLTIVLKYYLRLIYKGPEIGHKGKIYSLPLVSEKMDFV